MEIIKIRIPYRQYMDVSIKAENTKTELGFHGLKESEELKEHLLDVLSEVESFIEDHPEKGS